MEETLGFKKASPEQEETSLKYDGKTFPNEITELSFLQRLQTAGQLDEIKWSPVYFRRLQFLENKKRTGPTPEQITRYYALTKLINEGGLLEESRKEFIELQNLMERQNPPPRSGY